MKRDSIIGFFLILLIFIHGCIYNKAIGVLKYPDEQQNSPYGGWIQVILKSELEILGELLAVDDNYLYIATEEMQYFKVMIKDIEKATLWYYRPDPSSFVFWTLFGSLSTLSHGTLLVFSAPMWVIGGTLSAIGYVHADKLKYPNEEIVKFKKYARYPQGFLNNQPPMVFQDISELQ